MSNLNTGSTYKPEDNPRSKYCFAECKNVVSAKVLSRVVAAVSNVINDAVNSNSSEVVDTIVSTVSNSYCVVVSLNVLFPSL